MKKLKKSQKIILIASTSIVAVVVLVVGIFSIIYASRFKTMSSITKITDYKFESEINIYSMNVEYDYSIDDIIDREITNTQTFIDAIVSEALPGLPIKMKAPEFNCSAFGIRLDDGDYVMGRNYDFRYDSSAMLVYCSPKDGYKSVAFAALDNLNIAVADKNLKSKLACLTSPFICLDGMNEKGLSIAVLTLDSEPTVQDTEKPNICTTLAIRLVLDKAATTAEAVELLKQYDMIASSGRDYHFYINDASGDGRVVEWDCRSETRELIATPVRTVTNFFTIYEDIVTEDHDNGIYGHGKDRYNKIEKVFEQAEFYGSFTEKTAWDALQAAQQYPDDKDLTSNTQWSIVFNNTDQTLKIVFHRNWEDAVSYDLNDNKIDYKKEGIK